MTNKEAKAMLTHNLQNKELIDNSYQYEALDLAIKALEFVEKYFPNSFIDYINGVEM